MRRHVKIGLIVALIFAVIVTPLGLMGSHDSPSSSVAQILTLPALPVIIFLVQIMPPPMGESEIGPWDYMMFGTGVFVSAVVWGLIAGFICYRLKNNPNDAT